MKRIVLQGRRLPQKERVNVEREVLVQEWNGKTQLLLREGNTKVVSEARADHRPKKTSGVFASALHTHRICRD